MKNFKFFSRILCIFVLVFVFPFNCFALSISDYAPINDIIYPDTPFSDEIDVVDSSSPMLLASQSQNWLGDAGKLDGFEFSNAVLNSDRFIYLEYLPYGTDTLVLGFRNSINTAIYLIFLDARNTNLIVQTWNNNNGRCAIEIMSLSPIYRIAYGLAQGNVISFASYSGLTDKGVTVSTNSLGVDSYYFSYTFIANDFYFIATDNVYENSAIGIRFINETHVNDSYAGIDYDVDSYPTFIGRENELQQEQNDLINQGNQLQEEQNETTKSIWESIKSLPDIISDKLKGLFVPDEGFFSEYFNNLQTFFSEKLGFLVYPFDFIITFLQKYLDIGEGDGTLHLPDFEIMDVKIFNQTDFNLKNAMSSFLGEYYGIYFAFVDFIILVGLVNLALKKFNSMSGGNSE